MTSGPAPAADRRASAVEPRPLHLHRCTSPTVGPRRWNAYFVCGFTGYLLGLVLAMVLVQSQGLGLAARMIAALVPPMVFLVVVQLSIALLGHERIVHYQAVMAATAGTVIAALIAGAPLGGTVDAVVLGFGVGHACGRLGCFRVACCYGRIGRRGVRYSDAHAALGFPARLVGHRLLPVQLVELTVGFALVAVGLIAIARGAAPGVAAAAYFAGYGLVRCLLELVRGDDARPRRGGITEAQWSALATTAVMAAWQPRWWSLAAAAAVAAIVGVLLVARRRGGFDRLWLASAWHAAEVATAVDRLVAGGAPTTTSEGLKLSLARLPDGRLDVIASRTPRPLTLAPVRALADQLGGPWRDVEVVAGRTGGLFHVVLSPPAPAPASS